MDRTPKTTIYFHGMPGSPAELTLFPDTPQNTWHAFDRASLPPQFSAAERFDRLATMVQTLAHREPARIVAFSLGTFVALEVASRLPDAPLALDLISPAAPLQLGSFLDDMAGSMVFSLAADRPRLFRALACAQAMAARWAPKRLAAALFASASGADAALRSNTTFQTRIAAALRSSLVGGTDNYIAEVTAYTRDWSLLLQKVPHGVTLWQGDADNWTPPAMARALAERLPNVRACHTLPGLSHYSTLREALIRLT